MNESCAPPFPHQRESSGWTVPFSFEKAIYWASVCFYKKKLLLLEKLLKQRYMENKGCKLIIRNLQPLVKNVFDMSGFSQIFNIE